MGPTRRLSLVTLCILCALAASAAARAQGTGVLRGVVRDDESGEGLIGVDVLLVATPHKTQTDLEGRFEFGELPAGTYEVRVTYLGYNTRFLSGVEVAAGRTREIEIALESFKAYQGDDMVVSAARVLSTEGALLADRKSAAVVGDAISADQISRSPDGDSADALKRVPGLTVNNGKYVFVRGVTDRYNVTEVNGVTMSGANVERDRKSFNFDMVPANLLANVVVVKSATPDMPGDFAGGLVRITTLEFPEESTTSIGVSAARTGGTTCETFYRDNMTGDTDWLGVDDGGRGFPDHLLRENQPIGAAIFNNGLARALPNRWTSRGRPAPPKVSFNLSHGDQTGLFGGARLGYMAAFSYRNRFEREDENEFRVPDPIAAGESLSAEGQNSHYQVTWGGLANLFLKFGAHRIGLTNTYNRSADSDVRTSAGIQPDKNFAWTTISWQERYGMVNKLDGRHPFRLGGSGLELKWMGYYGESRATEPDRRYVQYNTNDVDQPFMDENLRMWSWLKEFRRGFGADLEYSLAEDDLEEGYKPRFKIGARTDDRERDFDVEAWSSRKTQHPFSQALGLLPVDTIFHPDNYNEIPDPVNGYRFDFGQDAFNSGVYTGTHDLFAYYAMADLPFEIFQEELRIVGGARIEDSDQLVETRTDKTRPSNVDTSRVDETDVLPSVNLTWNYDQHVNVRLGYYAAVNRPEFRELSPVLRRNFRTFQNERGNPDLERATIDNYDLRVEYFPDYGEVIAVSGFYKNFQDAIEDTLISSPERFVASFSNAPEAKNWGYELELRKKLDFWELTEDITVSGNYVRIWSEVDFLDPKTGEASVRPLQGQAPWSINAGILYNNPNTRTSFNVLFNRVGRKLKTIADNTALYVYQEPRNKLDLVFTQQLTSVLKLKAAAKDVLAEDALFTSGAEGREYEYSRVTQGAEYSVALSAKF